jgi:uncharacterized protein (TIGR02996 family)
MATATEREFLVAIRRAPDDVVAVQVYADWLVDQGDARGELIALQLREPELDRGGLERLLELAARFGFWRGPDDPDADVLRFAGGVRAIGGDVAVEYAIEHAGSSYVVLEGRAQLAVEVDHRRVFSAKPRGMIRPEVANVVLAHVSAAIILGTPLERLTLPETLASDPHYRVGRFPTEPIPAELRARWPGADAWHIDLRDLARWRALANRLTSAT